MLILLGAAATTGMAAFAATLWATGFGGESTFATGRLAKLRTPDENESASQGLGLRRRASISLGGINLVSANLAQNWATELERAGLALNTREYFILRVAAAAVLAIVAFILLPFPLLAPGGAVIGFVMVGLLIKRRIKSRVHKLESQMVEMLQMIASGLRAGFGLIQAMEAAGEQLPAPLSVEIRRTLRDIAMGSSIEQALTALNERVGSSDFDIVVTAMLIQRAVGGNLAEILDNVAHTMRERERIKGEIRTLTSQQRMTGFVIGGIPIGLLMLFSVMNPAFVGLLFTESLGRMMLIGAAILELMGAFVISRIVNIEV